MICMMLAACCGVAALEFMSWTVRIMPYLIINGIDVYELRYFNCLRG